MQSNLTGEFSMAAMNIANQIPHQAPMQNHTFAVVSSHCGLHQTTAG